MTPHHRGIVMANPVVLLCAICGRADVRMAVDHGNALAYCSADYGGFFSPHPTTGECPKCRYRFAAGNAAWFFRTPDKDRQCPACCGSLDAYSANLGLASSELATAATRVRALRELAQLITTSAAVTAQQRCTVRDLIIAAIDRKEVKEWDNPSLLVEAVCGVGGDEARSALKRWDRFFSGHPKAIKNACRKSSPGIG